MKIESQTTNIHPGDMVKLLRIFTGFLLLWLFVAPAMAASITASPSSCVNTSGIGTQPWMPTGGSLPATASVSSGNRTTNYLTCTGYNFSIPAGATIDGIVVGVSRYNAARGTIQDMAMRLIDATGAIGTTDRSTTTAYPTQTTTGTLENHGIGTTDLWGTAWTSGNINSPNFGAAFASTYTGNNNSGHMVGVDGMSITVYYTILAAPSATTDPATSITDALATLNGTVSSNGASTTVTFDYGTTTAYGSTATATQSPLAAGATATAVSAAVTGLTCGATYHFRVSGTNSIGTTNGSDATFTTLACPGPPTATTGTATSITTTGATLNGTVDDNGGDTVASFDYGTTTSYDTNVTATPATVTTGSGNTAVAAALTGLTCNTTYHFRVKGINSSGTTNGNDATLTTSACSTTGTATVTASPANCSDITTGTPVFGTQAWSNPGNATASDNIYATARVNDNQITHYLQCLGYNFNIPSNATITGIVVSVERNASNTNVTDAAMRLVKAGTIQATDRSTATFYTTTDTYEDHGGSADLWSGAWTPADINDANFGAAFASQKPSTSGGNRTVSVDHMPITVYYSYPLTPPSVTSIDRAGPNPTSAASVSWTVTFDQAVAGVDASDFVLVATGVTSTITSVTEASGTGINTTWTVTSIGTGAGTLGLNLVDDDSIVNPTTGLKLGGIGTGNGNFTGQVYTIMNNCVGGNFGSTLDTNQWDVQTIMGTYLPQIINAGGGDYRLRLTDTGGNEATFAQLKNLFPAYGNKVVLTFDYFSYGGSGADGMAVTFSDATIASTTGGFGGSLGYAQNGTNPGFGGGWLGIGLDEYGNYPCTNESRTGYPAGWTDPVLGNVTPCTGSGGGNHYVAIRGSGSGTAGYNLIANTGLIAATAPATGAAGDSPYRYRVTLDHSDSIHAYVSVERDTTGTGNSYSTLIPKFDIKAASTQATVPTDWLISFTGSTGGATNNHELKQVQVCANTVAGVGVENHLLIEHDGTAISCSPETVTVTACANTDCSSPYTGGVSGYLTAGGTGGNIVAFTIPNGQSQTTVNIHIPSDYSALTDPQTVRLGTSAVSPVPGDTTSPYCSINGGAPDNTTACDMSVSKAGFLFDVPNFASGTATGTVDVSAVRSSDSTTCIPLFQNVTRTVAFWSNYQNPASGTLPLQLNGSNIETTSSPAYSSTYSLYFDNSGIATLSSVQYDDVGQMQLNARYVGSIANTPPDGGMIVLGSDNFVVKPAGFVLSGIKRTSDGMANPAAADAAGTKFVKAGENFSATVTAINALGNTTPNYGKESTPESVKLTSALVAPGSGGHNPALAGNFGSFGYDCTDTADSAWNGKACGTAFTWGEVGIITLTPSVGDGDYLGAGDVTGTTSGNVGRFYPDHFSTSVTGPMACPSALTCPTGGLTYSGQPFTVNVYALNASGGTTTNYDNTLGFSKGVTLSAWDAAGSTVTQNPPSGSDALNSTAVPATSFTSGTTAVGTPATPDYAFNTTPTAPTDIYIRASDTDGVTSLGPTSDESGIKVVSGRIKLSNAYGSDLLDLPIGVTVQYWDGASYVTSSTDNVSKFFTTATGLTFSNCQKLPPSMTALPYCPPATLPTPASVVFINGTGSFTLSKPDSGNTGSVNMNIISPSYLGSNTARATFGIYSGNRSFIYLRERY